MATVGAILATVSLRMATHRLRVATVSVNLDTIGAQMATHLQFMRDTSIKTVTKCIGRDGFGGLLIGIEENLVQTRESSINATFPSLPK